jgi:hypothetical protein
MVDGLRIAALFAATLFAATLLAAAFGSRARSSILLLPALAGGILASRINGENSRFALLRLF